MRLAVVLLITVATIHVAAQTFERRLAPGDLPITMRPSALAATISQLAGYRVNVPLARILWVIDSHALVIESDSLMGPRWRDRGRVLVLVPKERALAIPRPPIGIAPVTVVGTARTLLGVQAAHDVPWPEPLTRAEVQRLDIRAAIIAISVRTADGVDLTSSAAR